VSIQFSTRYGTFYALHDDQEIGILSQYRITGSLGC
jgi:hypothetical protein